MKMPKKSKKKSKKKNEEEYNYNFDPPLKCRYLPGEASPSYVLADFEKYKQHRVLLAQAKAVVDDKPPRIRVKAYYDKDKLEEDARLAMINIRQNLDLARDINTKFRMEAKVDCWNLTQKVIPSDQRILKNEYKAIMKINKRLYECINELGSEYSPHLMAQDWKRLKAVIEHQSRYPWFKDEHKHSSITDLSMVKREVPAQRLRCFFDLELDQTKSYLGRIVFELYSEYAPRACANFEAFCKGYNGLCYKGTPFHRILSDYGCQGGDVTKYNGLGGASIYDDFGRDGQNPLKHMCPGVLSSYNDADGPCDSKFNISFRPLRSMDGKKLVFGKVISGFVVLSKIDAYGSKFGRPLQKVVVANCGTHPDKPLINRSEKVLESHSLASRGLRSPKCATSKVDRN